ncbi:sugar ABC transporter permease [Frankia sp. CNm7]|uniref:Sugar ABC transporter permease n=1 Tax=Frankia nepalensis TaxID=1836974 RepID=A0A937RVE6_9ACTN|nr:sugar ABC transporter permease [Frankia nepalensis]MBL7500778.1 sugar ABC transporter permease [Frankia nepalensis]MBL7515550.1 sugar ABC transporter permease [Frankia nepalensis]MBL7519088.1 sugar ABC transporter permease [Frankia nepalensis]MBL7633533.1 sugar ABC transporter permease [Frankia nepalensis]
MAPWLYQAPVLVSLAVWVYGPLVFTGVLSLLEWDLTSPDRSFVGLDNYRRLAEEPEFPHALTRTGLYVLAMLPFATVVPMALAVMLWKRPGRASDTYRSLLFLPVVLAPVATALAWRFILDPLGGVVNLTLGGLGLPEQDWLGDPDTALWAISLITAGKFVALNMLLYGAALASLDGRALDAARVDGATEWEITRHLVVPQLTGTTVLMSFLCVVFAGQWTFTNIAVLTQGGPDNSTDNAYLRLYTYAFVFFDAGTGAAAAVAIVVLLTVLFAVSAPLRRRHARP